MVLLDSIPDGGAAAVGGLSLVFVVVVVIGLYWVPTIVALSRNTGNKWTVLVINFFLGWTFIGWVVALAMSFGSNQSPITVVNVASGHPSGAAAVPVGGGSPPMSPDGTHYWDGYGWRPASPPQA